MKDCCPICKELDGKRFKVKDMECGKNAPPMHPNCHCATAPHYDSKSFYEWLDERQSGKTELGFTEWKNYYVRFEQKDMQEADDLLKEPTSQVWKSLTSKQKDSLIGYTGYGYSEVNKVLRGLQSNASEMAKNNIRNITNALKKSKMPKNVTLSRNVYYDDIEKFLGVNTRDLMYNSIEELKQKFEGSTILERGFTSTTVINNDECSRDIKFEIKVPKGANAMYVQPFTSYGNDDGYVWDGISNYRLGGEMEVLIQRGAQYSIEEISRPYLNHKLLIKLRLEGFEDD